ncbi:uroporphyrin-III C-m [Phellopilus nigrolimitatus]|nr:uroporphyrin-III C-m [Phellopilus nigrolimitatus]
MLAFRMDAKLTLIVGSNRLAATRAFSALEAGSAVVILANGGMKSACDELTWRAENKQLEIIDFDDLAGPSESSRDREVSAVESFLDERGSGSVSLVFITDTLVSSEISLSRSQASATQIYLACRKRNIPVNVTDMPSLCDFTVCATHRCLDPQTGRATPLQVAITTNGHGCRLAGRIKREVVAKLDSDAGVAVEKVSQLRTLAKNASDDYEEAESELNEETTVASPNRPVAQRLSKMEESAKERARRRMKWVAQISEYWSLRQLASLDEKEMTNTLSGELLSPNCVPTQTPSGPAPSQHDLAISPPKKKGRVLLVGSGPGHPSLLTLAAHAALTREADLVLTDKLVPAGVLALIPPHIEVRVARKFPGNADGAQQEMMDMALAAARAGRTVVRLKQGDPALYGRVGEELLFLRAYGVDVLIIPGISSALAAPLFAHIPVTQRGAAEALAVCTGVGRGGKGVRLPGYERARTLVVLMGVARLQSMVDALLSNELSERRTDAAYPPYVPAAVIERASMPDQRVVVAPLRDIAAALESVGEQRPPGLLVVGWAVLSLWGLGDMTVLNEGDGNAREIETKDKERIERWLEGRRWRVTEGLDPLWAMFDAPIPPA